MGEKPLDEFIMRENLERVISEYRITNDHRNYMLICTSIIMLNILGTSFGVFFPHVTGLNLVQNQLLSTLLIIVNAYSCYFLFNYFSYYKLNLLAKITLFLFVSDVVEELLFLLNIINLEVPSIIGTINTVLAIPLMIIWSVKIFRIDNHKFSSIKFLRYAAIALIVTFCLSFSAGLALPFLIEDYHLYITILGSPLIMYYFFILKFSLQLKTIQE